MIRLLVFFLIIVAAGVGVAWLADHPGALTLNWQGLRIQTSLPVLAVVAAGLAVIVYLLSRVWVWLVKSPAALRISRRFKQTDRGYNVLTEGLAAAMTGDARTALKAADRAEKLLGPGSATQLLRAQAAQMAGDEALAESNFNKLLENPETEIVGLRGLLALARMQGDQDRAVTLALQARKKRPDADWAVRSLFELQIDGADWSNAARTLDQGAGAGVFSGDEAKRLKAVLHVVQGQAAHENADARAAMAHARAAHKAAPDFVPAIVLLARLRLADGAKRRAKSLILGAYQQAPHPDLMQVFLELEPDERPSARLKRLAALTGPAADHVETLLAKAMAAAADEDDNTTRLYLREAISQSNDQPDQRICREMVALEERTPDGTERARDWLGRLAAAPTPPGWVCTSCAEPSADWSAACPSCNLFDGLRWSDHAGTQALAILTPGPTTETLADDDPDPVEAPDQPVSEPVLESAPEDEIVIEEEPATPEPARQDPVADDVVEEVEEQKTPEPLKVLTPDLPRPDTGPDEPTIEDKARAAL